MVGVERMSAVDRAWLLMESPASPMMVVGLMICAAPIAYERLCELVTTRFLAFERFRCRPVADTLDARWVPQEDFAVTDHVFRAGLPGGAGQQELEALVAELASVGLSAQRPLWSFHLVEQYAGGSALIVRIHHSYADGIALVQVLLSMTDAHAEESLGTRVPAQQSGLLDQLWSESGELLGLLEKGMHYAFNPGEAVSLATELARIAVLTDDPPTGLKRALTGVRRVAWATLFSFEEVRTIAHVLGCTINTVLLSTLAGALGRYLEAHHDGMPGMALRCVVPVNLRPGSAAATPLSLGNHFGLVFVDLPVGLRHPLERLYAVHASMQRLKGSPQALITLGLLSIVGRLTAGALSPVVEVLSAKASLVVSNVPGPREQLFLAGAPVAQTQFWVPQTGSIGVGVSLLTYNGEVQFGVMADRALMDEPRELVELMSREFERLVLLLMLGGGAFVES